MAKILITTIFFATKLNPRSLITQINNLKKVTADYIMVKRAAVVPFATIMLDPMSEIPLHRQLYDGLRTGILTGRFPGKTRLPSTRALANQLGVSRNTVINAFEQLMAEGYLEGRVGAGTYVAAILPETRLHTTSTQKDSAQPLHHRRVLSQRGRVLTEARVSFADNFGADSGSPRAFTVGLPSFDDFPFEIWAKLLARRWRYPDYSHLGYCHPGGLLPLREAISVYLNTTRAVACTPEQIIIVNGTQQGIDLIVRLLLDAGDEVWLEDPAFIGARGAFLGSGAKLIPVPVDKEGLNVAEGIVQAANARMAYVTPSHQFPLGSTMSLARRLALLAWAKQADSWILEDDYACNFRYAGRPLSALQGLDNEGQVIYLGTLSKALLPTLRLGYLVVPTALVDQFLNAQALLNRFAPVLEQAALADFINDGHFGRHLRRMCALYGQRQQTLIDEINRQANGLLEVAPNESGLHLVAYLPDGSDDRVIAKLAGEYGVAVTPLSPHYLASPMRPGLLLGYTAITPPKIRSGIERLVAAIEHSQRRNSHKSAC